VKFGIDAAVESGHLTSLLVKGVGTATFEVRLLWKPNHNGEANLAGGS
jgi:hypothetical protein